MSGYALTKSRTVIAGAALLSLYWATALAQPATDVDCFRCVNTIDIDIGAVTTNRIAPGAVTTDRIPPLAIGTGRLALGAVTTNRIAPGAVTTTRIAPGAVTTDRIPPLAIGTGRIAPGAVTTDRIAPLAIGPGRLALGAVTANRFADGAVTAEKLALANTIFIDASGSNSANCADLLSALSGLTGPATVVLGPGTYDCGSSPVVLPANVGLIGSDENLTTITGSVDSSDGLVRLADDTELRDLTVVNDDSGGAGTFFFAVRIGAGNVNTQNWRISDVTARAMGGSTEASGVFAAADDCDGGEMINVTATASGATNLNHAIEAQCGPGLITGTNLSATGTGGTTARGLARFSTGLVTVRNSSFVGATNSIGGGGFFGTTKVISSELDGTVGGSVNTLICVGAYDGAGNALADGTLASGGCL